MAGPRSRRRPVVFAVVVTFFLVVVLVAGGSSSSRPDTSEAVQAYLDQVRPGVQETASQGADFADIRNQATALGRNGLDRRVDRLLNEVNATLSSIDTLVPPPSMRVPQAYLVAALGVRAKAVSESRAGFDDALTIGAAPEEDVTKPVAELGQVGQDLDLGDRAFSLFTDSLPPGSGMPEAAPWLTNAEMWSAIPLTAFVQLVRSSAAAQPVHHVDILTFQTNPAAVSVATTPDHAEVIPASPTMSVSMVVENVGNQPEQNVTIMVIFNRSDGGVETLRDFIDMSPGETRSITLTPMPTESGMAGKLTVEVLPVFGETDLSNTSIVTPVSFR